MSQRYCRAQSLARPIAWLSPQAGASIRFASLNSAIGRGIRRSQGPRNPTARDSDLEDIGRRPRKDREWLNQNRRDISPRYQSEKKTFSRTKNDMFDNVTPSSRPRNKMRGDNFDQNTFIRTGNFERPVRDQQPRGHRESKESRIGGMRGMPLPSEKAKGPSKSRAHRATEGMPERVKEHVKVPDSVPYSTPASEFIYGTGAVEAALRCSRRQLYKLYLYQAAGEDLNPTKVALRKLALSKNIETKLAFAGWDRLLDKMSAGRPHNGCVLEASPLPKLPVRGFHPVPTATEEHFRVELAPQSREEAAVNGTNDRIPIVQSPSGQGRPNERYPVALLLDGVVDPGNMGAIIRSAYFLGIDAIVLAGRNSAPLSPVTIKASAGAAENMTLLHVKNEVDFIQRSKNNGWRFYAADAPSPGAEYIGRGTGTNESESRALPVSQAPSVLMMGSEASGLSTHIKSHADAIVSIPGARHSAELGARSDPARIDSLNVSVAAALLMEMFLRTPLAVSELAKKRKDQI
ncbi:uncharacterized protein N7469_007983 [Penicillium citrinum]|uniref:rRNA methyltransferase 1, mitochondrial n=1 Tax=Penicillium citrinum TaxID=5077 RepID=A0A9W9TKF2_PENCI|nr:uncharacterized protein N7469_007983 [Penicillium citrinum]KAJ5224480.1 hypothetical protein N7469_007983 [Penicillium citrinum]